nr:MAG TPA: hypothetical protein [Caudoviricetes sp.]
MCFAEGAQGVGGVGADIMEGFRFFEHDGQMDYLLFLW